MNTITLPINDILVIDDFNVRAQALSQARIAEYTETFRQLPPIGVFEVDGKYYLVDGWHRIEAARKLELQELEVELVGKGILVEAQDYADKANLKHGLPLTPEQRRCVAVRFVKRHPDWSLREVAEQIGCSHQSVKLWVENDAVKNLTVDELNQENTEKASQSERAGGVDIMAVTLKFKEWFNKAVRESTPATWTPERKLRVKQHLQPIVQFYQSL